MSTSSSLLPSNLTQILQTTLDTTRKQTVGVVAGLVSEQGEWFSTSGVRNLATNSPLTASDRFQIGSITKTFVATTVLQLVESGVLKLDDTLSKWLPSTLVGRIPFSNEIKISQLLNHTSGIFNYVDIIFDQGTSLFNTWTTEELIAFTYDRPPYFTPGTSWTYSNTNYVLLGEIVEAATGMNLSQVIRERILNPLGMNNTFFATEENVSGVVNGYWDIDGDGRLNDVSFLNLSWAGASGNMVSNAQDLAHFAEALFGGKLLQPTTLQQMLTLVDTPNSNTFNGYGFGIARLRNVEGVVYGHNGLTLGYRANLWYSPEESLTYVDLQNTRVFTNFVAPILTSFRAEQSGSIPEISFTLTPNQLNEAEGTVLTFNFKVDGKIPPKGLTVKLNGDAPNTLLELLAGEIEFESPTETEFEFIPENLQIKGGTLGLVDPDFSSFTFTITEANASISFKVFDDIFEEGTESFTYALAVQGDNYTINRLANSATFTITDGVPGGVVPKVGMTANQTALYEDEGTVITLTFKVDGEIPADGLIVFVDSTQGYGSIGALGQFDVFNVTTSGLSIVGTDEDASGIYLKITRPTASLSVPIFVDDSIEGSIPYTFTLINGERYEVKSDAQAVNLIIGDSAPFNIINGKSTDDVLRGTEGKDAIYAMAGYDSLYGMGGNDVLIGGADGDLIFGGDGNDLLVGNTGDDVLFGGAGLDIFAFKKGDGTDIISDFKVGEDKIGVIKGEIKPEDILFTQVGGLAVAKVKSTGETLAYLQGVDVSKLNASSVVEVTNQPIIPNNTYAPTILVANRQEYNPQIYDPTFALGWGLAIRPAGFGGHFWVTANGSGASYQYVGDVNIGKPNAVPLYQDDLALVTVPGSNNTQGTPTGVVFNGSNNFVITQPYAGGNITGPSRFFFATDSGTISAWTERQNPNGTFDRSDAAKIVIDNSARGDQYFGLAVNPKGDRLFVANFGVNPNVQVFDGNFKDITPSFNGFVNPFVGTDGFQPGEYAPFNIQVLEAGTQASVFVAYAKTQEDPNEPGQLLVGEEEAGTGLGRIAEFDITGQLIRVWNDSGLLNSPWGFAYAPDNFGGLSDTLLVSNFSDGTITAFDRNTHQAVDYLRDVTGQPLAARGIWGILFGNGASLGDTNSLYIAVGPEDLGDGVFGRLNYVSVGSSDSSNNRTGFVADPMPSYVSGIEAPISVV
jgi:uncharacterized protein (TIGR03118 family)